MAVAVAVVVTVVPEDDEEEDSEAMVSDWSYVQTVLLPSEDSVTSSNVDNDDSIIAATCSWYRSTAGSFIESSSMEQSNSSDLPYGSSR